MSKHTPGPLTEEIRATLIEALNELRDGPVDIDADTEAEDKAWIADLKVRCDEAARWLNYKYGGTPALAQSLDDMDETAARLRKVRAAAPELLAALRELLQLNAPATDEHAAARERARAGVDMGASPFFKVYNARNQYRAACVDASEAAAVVSVLGDGATIRASHSNADTLWCEGAEDHPAAESYDYVARVVIIRLDALRAAYYAKSHPETARR